MRQEIPRACFDPMSGLRPEGLSSRFWEAESDTTPPASPQASHQRVSLPEDDARRIMIDLIVDVLVYLTLVLTRSILGS